MKGHRGCILSLVVLSLAVLVGMVILFQQHQRVVQARVALYTSVLRQAPCLETVCPGFDGGRNRALERLASSELLQGSEQGHTRIRLSFILKNARLGYGIIEFTSDSEAGQGTVDHISLVLHELRLEPVISALGDPDEFLFISGCGMGRRVYARLYYLEEGIVVNIEYPTRRPGSEMLQGATPVNAIVYILPGNIQNHIVASAEGLIAPYNVAYDFHSSVGTDDILAQIRPWPGLAASPTPSADFCPR